MNTPLLRVMTRGAFAIVSRERGDVTPRGRKTRGLVALLAMAPGLRRERDWLKEHLWSDRRPAQAAGSLRSALVELRECWGPEAAALLGKRRPWVALDKALVEVDASGEGALLEGIGVYDARFREWIAVQRKADGVGLLPAEGVGPATALAVRPELDPASITIRCPPARGTSSAAILGDIVSHQIAEGIAEQIKAHRVVRTDDDARVDVDVHCDVVETGAESLAFVRVVHAPTGQVLYERRHRGDGPAAMLIANDGMKRTAHEAIEITIGRLPQVLSLDRPVLKAAALSRLALLRMFSYEPDALTEADRLFAQAHELSPGGILDAWRGFLQMVKWIDMGRDRTEDLKEGATEFVRRAERAADDNAVIQALVAYTRVEFLGDVEGALRWASRAVETNPTNPMPLVSLARAQLLAGRPETAYALSRRAWSYAQRSRFRHFFANHHCTISMATGQTAEAVTAAEAAVSDVPNFAAAHRHLLALYAGRGDVERAHRMRERLTEIQPGFSLDRMLHDPDYPVTTLRRTGLLKAAGRIL